MFRSFLHKAVIHSLYIWFAHVNFLEEPNGLQWFFLSCWFYCCNDLPKTQRNSAIFKYRRILTYHLDELPRHGQASEGNPLLWRTPGRPDRGSFSMQHSCFLLFRGFASHKFTYTHNPSQQHLRSPCNKPSACGLLVSTSVTNGAHRAPFQFENSVSLTHSAAVADDHFADYEVVSLLQFRSRSSSHAVNLHEGHPFQSR